jgi:hypothetical protein
LENPGKKVANIKIIANKNAWHQEAAAVSGERGAIKEK